MRRSQRGIEEKILDNVEATVGHKYDTILRNVTYNGYLCGELDAQAWQGNVFDYYEAKAHLHPLSEKRALEQFARARKYYGNRLRDCYIATRYSIYGPYPASTDTAQH